MKKNKEENKMKKKTYKISGDFIIRKQLQLNTFWIDDTRLSEDDIVHLPISVLKEIINDAKNKLI